ncbi:uncharacterized protein LOC111011235 [Momordica charantia]|uniref:Uncharacterized protein LOC111011235 n=1 Tax=Momordica charantia TaxID=3673 RepID=A0A6J1CFL5_MOMCH|nr:uncharacterized protein LOC111011235 [Momordica charantia]
MKIFISIFAVSITVFFFLSLSAAFSWTLYLSATIHKSYMFLLCNSLLVFICLNSPSTVNSLDGSRTVGEVGDEKETGSLHVVRVFEDQILIAEDNDEKAGETLFVEETRDDELEVREDDMTLFVIEEIHDDELEAKDDRTLSVVEEIHDDNEQEQGGGDVDMILSIVEETRDDELEVVEDDMTLFDVEETQDDELEAADDKTLSVVKETHDDEQEQEQGGGNDMISLEELNKKFDEFIRTTRMKIRAELLTIQCY